MQVHSNTSPRLQKILDYISSGWDTLVRSTITCEGVADPKFTEGSMLYEPADFFIAATSIDAFRHCGIQVKHLPSPIRRPGQFKGNEIHPPGLLYLEHPYVVPGGRFNEMYGWDSYFIIRGLLRAGKIDLARGMVENFFFEIANYGAVINANRTYYLTRSQPPFLTSMIMEVYEAEKVHGHADRDWLKKAYSFAVRDYTMWTTEPHLAGDTGLSRYYDFGEGPAPEGLHDEVGYYHDVLAYFIKQSVNGPALVEADSPNALPHPDYSQEICPDLAAPASVNSLASNSKCLHPRYIGLSADYYKGDRSMRESGFDITFSGPTERIPMTTLPSALTACSTRSKPIWKR